MTTASQLSRFKSQLERLNCDYHLIGEAGGERVELQFIGPFEGKEVVWNATFITLAAYSSNHPDAPPRNFIDIEVAANDMYTIKVGLPIARFSEREIAMTIRMVRQYKRLHRGRYEYGAPYAG